MSTIAPADVRCIAVSSDQYAVQVRGDSLIIGYVRKLSARRWKATTARGRGLVDQTTRANAVAVILRECA